MIQAYGNILKTNSLWICFSLYENKLYFSLQFLRVYEDASLWFFEVDISRCYFQVCIPNIRHRWLRAHITGAGDCADNESHVWHMQYRGTSWVIWTLALGIPFWNKNGSIFKCFKHLNFQLFIRKVNVLFLVLQIIWNFLPQYNLKGFQYQQWNQILKICFFYNYNTFYVLFPR